MIADPPRNLLNAWFEGARMVMSVALAKAAARRGNTLMILVKLESSGVASSNWAKLGVDWADTVAAAIQARASDLKYITGAD